MKRLAMATKGCGQLTSNDPYFAYSWFSSVKTAQEVISAGVYCCGPVKTSHKRFCLSTLEKSSKYCPVGSNIVMNITPRVPGGILLLAIGCEYNSSNVLGFIYSEGSRSTEPCDPYLSLLFDIYSNVSVHPVVRPHLLGRYFNSCYSI